MTTTRTRTASRSLSARSGREPAKVQLITDPWSVWCWGFEPVRRTLETRYPTIRFEPYVGGMFERMPNPDEVPFDLDRFFAQVQRTTGMPIESRIVVRERPKSTYPACVHYHAARLAAPSKASAFLRAAREAIYLDGRDPGRPVVAAELAKNVGISSRSYQAALASGQAKEQFDGRLNELQKSGIHGYPTILITVRGRTTRVEGFQSLPALLGIVEALSGEFHPPSLDPDLATLVPAGERVATREVAEAWGVSVERAVERLEAEAAKRRLVRQRFGTGDVWSRPTP